MASRPRLDVMRELGVQRASEIIDRQLLSQKACINLATGCWTSFIIPTQKGYCQVKTYSNLDLPQVKTHSNSDRDEKGPTKSFLLHVTSFVANNERNQTPGTDVSHLCHNRCCFNPKHLVDESPRINNNRKGCAGQIFCSAHRTSIIDLCSGEHDPPCIRPQYRDVNCCHANEASDGPPDSRPQQLCDINLRPGHDHTWTFTAMQTFGRSRFCDITSSAESSDITSSEESSDTTSSEECCEFTRRAEGAMWAFVYMGVPVRLLALLFRTEQTVVEDIKKRVDECEIVLRDEKFSKWAKGAMWAFLHMGVSAQIVAQQFRTKEKVVNRIKQRVDKRAKIQLRLNGARVGKASTGRKKKIKAPNSTTSPHQKHGAPTLKSWAGLCAQMPELELQEDTADSGVPSRPQTAPSVADFREKVDQAAIAALTGEQSAVTLRILCAMPQSWLQARRHSWRVNNCSIDPALDCWIYDGAPSHKAYAKDNMRNTHTRL
ncbi:zinc-binding loop region of homing endonuclease domain-containing [Fusarium albosuccineum]|uniref:Zinc-binding loop region of homing endonuclease domain-containing n=1 Tax=Fusarium albosuccineum TaxID=1237068 RepID=A0A8H4PJ43_9HYPO|nr:zinc-binding loop region of homing endonuclease domain-containing [Fusarium albosuccineum]